MHQKKVLEFKAERFTYRRRMELGLVITLSVLLILIHVLPKRMHTAELEIVYVDFNIENVEIPPTTRQQARIAPPLLPQLPIPSEDEWLPEEATIDESILELAFLELPDPPSELPYDGQRRLVFRAKKKEKHTEKRRKGKDIVLALMVDVHGQVDSLYVVKNPSGDADILAEAIRTAYRTRFIDDRPKNKAVHWIKRKF